MNINRAWAVAAMAVLAPVSHSPASAQQIVIEGMQVGEPMMMPGMGPRGATAKTGTGRINGRVVSAETGQPVRRAQVRLSSPESGVKLSMTDADGRFDFRELPAGRFTLSATKSGYVQVAYGQSRPFEQG